MKKLLRLTALTLAFTFLTPCAWAQWSGSGTQADPYQISSATDWNTFASNVNGGTTYSGKYFKLMANISVTNMVGTRNKKFSGTFDGDGHTLTFNQDNATEQYIAPFRYINSATIKNLKVAGTVTSSDKFAGGVVAHATGSNAITNCVNSTIINATASNGSHGGILGQLGDKNNSVTISGCLFNGKMLGSNTDYWCGIIGYYGSNSVTINNCYFNPEEINVKANNYNYTICRPGPTVNNCYYNTEADEMYQKQGNLRHSITGGTNFSVENAGSAIVYDVSGITSYGTGIKYNNVLYAGNGDNVSLSLTVPMGYVVSNVTYTPEGGSATAMTETTGVYSLTMPNADVTITATVSPAEWEGTGADWEHAYQIWNSGQLDMLASRVNGESSTTYNDKYYKLMADITYDGTVANNYTAIGATIQNQFSHDFNGHFDGQGHTVSGINSVSQCVYYNGLFGKLESGAEVKNVILANCNIGDGERAGGIAGWNKGNVTDCYVTSDVTVKGTSPASAQHGGIVGANEGTISRCIFEGTLTKTFSNPDPEDVINVYAYGGIAGINNTNGTLSDNFVASAVIPATMHGYGTVVGLSNGTLNRNYYTACTVNGVANATGVGYATISGNNIVFGDLTTNDGAVPFLQVAAQGWHAVSSPLHDYNQNYESLTNVTNLIPSADEFGYDLFGYDEEQAKWLNQKSGSDAIGFSSFEQANGYIYRRSVEGILHFTGQPTIGNFDYTISYTSTSGDLAGFNLIGNPYTHRVVLDYDFYELRPDGTWIEHNSGDYISVGQAVLVYTDNTLGETLHFSPEGISANSGAKGSLPPLPKALCLGSNSSSNQALTQSSNSNIARWNGEAWVIEGNGTLQVFDVMGRQLFTTEVVSSPLTILRSQFPTTGVYILRLNGKTQKIIIK